MKLKVIILIAFCCGVTVVIGSPAPAADSASRPNYKEIELEELETELGEPGKYHYSYENSNGAKVSQDGELKQLDADNAIQTVKGSFSFTDDAGIPVSLTYTADETGYHPVGDLPTPPPIPPAIQKALDYLATLPSTTEGSSRK